MLVGVGGLLSSSSHDSGICAFSARCSLQGRSVKERARGGEGSRAQNILGSVTYGALYTLSMSSSRVTEMVPISTSRWPWLSFVCILPSFVSEYWPPWFRCAMVFDDPFRSFAAIDREPMDVKELGREPSIA